VSRFANAPGRRKSGAILSEMSRIRISMRWWLGLSFALIAALTALSVAQVFNHRAETALRQRGEELAVGQSVSAASAVAQALRQGVLPAAASLIAERRRSSIYVFNAAGEPITPTTSRGVRFSAIPDGRLALNVSLGGDRYVLPTSFVVALRIPETGGAIVTYTHRPELLAELGIVRDQILTASLIAVAVGALAGLLVAWLITARLRRIGAAAARIESGAFDEPLRSSFGDELGVLAETIDQMRERLRDSFGRLGAERDRLEQLLEGLDEGVVAVDRSLRVGFANRAARALVPDAAFSPGEDLPEPWPDFPLRAFTGRLFADLGQPAQARVVAHDRTFALVGIPARGGVDAILVLSDISERERRERAEREFVANAAHELGTPLTAIATSLEVLRAGAKDEPEERDRFLAVIERQTSRLSRLRRALLALARAQTRQEALQLEPVHLRRLLVEVAGDVRAANPAADVAVLAPDDLVVLAHPELAEQVVLNLAENALRHGGAGRVELAVVPLDGRQAAIEVRDDGSGIPPSAQGRLFDRFYRGQDRRDSEGFGLGLAIVREAVRALGGTIELESQPEGGTVVRVTLARQEAPVR
jgi:two-component system sensor histidine kinase VicK